MNTNNESRVELARIVATLVENLGDELFPPAAINSSVRLRFDARNVDIRYVDVSALREFFEENVRLVRSVCSRSDLDDLISDGIRSARANVARACLALQGALNADSVVRGRDLYDGEFSYVTGSYSFSTRILGARGPSPGLYLDTFHDSSDILLHVIDGKGRAMRRPGMRLAYSDALTFGCEWQSALECSQRLVLLSALHYRHAYHHLFAIMKDAEGELQYVTDTDEDETLINEKFVDIYESVRSVADEQRRIFVAHANETVASISSAGVSEHFFGEQPANPMERQLKENSKITYLYSNSHSQALRNENVDSISAAGVSRLFFGLKKDDEES